MFAAVPAREVSMAGVCPVTVTVSASEASDILKLTA
jgi:hypothetical protein